MGFQWTNIVIEFSLYSTGLTQEGWKLSWHERKIVDGIVVCMFKDFM